MAYTASNVIVGAPAQVKVGVYGGGEGAATDIGATSGGVTINYDREYHEVEVDQNLCPIDAILTKERATIVMTIPEASLVNLAIAFDYAAGAVSGTTFKFGNNQTRTKRELFITGQSAYGAGGGTWKWTFYRVISVGNASQAYVKDDKTVIDIEFLVIADTTKTVAEQLGQCDITGADTTAPTIALTTPAEDGTVTGSSSDTVTLTITEAVQVDESSIKYGSVDGATIMINNITDTAATVLVAGTIVYNSASKTVVFTPSSTWADTSKFQVIVTTGLKDLNGNHLAEPLLAHFTSTTP